MTSMYYSSTVKIPYNASHVCDDYFKVSRINLIYLLSRLLLTAHFLLCIVFMAEAESGGLARLWRGRDVVGSAGARDVADSEVGLETWMTE